LSFWVLKVFFVKETKKRRFLKPISKADMTQHDMKERRPKDT